jgi:hypothetical protein
LWTICLGWLWPVILLISASWVARITGVSHWRVAEKYILKQHIHGCWAQWLTPVIPVTQEVDIWRTTVWGQPRTNVSKTPISTKKLGVVACTCYLSYVGLISRRITVQVSTRKNHDTLPEK